MLFERPILQIERRIKIKEKVILIEYGSSTTFQVKSVHFADLLYSVEKKCAECVSAKSRIDQSTSRRPARKYKILPFSRRKYALAAYPN
jgi:hypothetical protein